MSKWSHLTQGGALVGSALFICATAIADEALRERVHKEYKHQSYMLIEDTDGARLYLFGTGKDPAGMQIVGNHDDTYIGDALEKTHSTDPRTRVRGLTELAGADEPEALDTALALLSDPNVAVRDEATHLILDHPLGDDVAAALGLVDEDDADE